MYAVCLVLSAHLCNKFATNKSISLHANFNCIFPSYDVFAFTLMFDAEIAIMNCNLKLAFCTIRLASMAHMLVCKLNVYLIYLKKRFEIKYMFKEECLYIFNYVNKNI